MGFKKAQKEVNGCLMRYKKFKLGNFHKKHLPPRRRKKVKQKNSHNFITPKESVRARKGAF